MRISIGCRYLTTSSCPSASRSDRGLPSSAVMRGFPILYLGAMHFVVFDFRSLKTRLVTIPNTEHVEIHLSPPFVPSPHRSPLFFPEVPYEAPNVVFAWIRVAPMSIER